MRIILLRLPVASVCAVRFRGCRRTIVVEVCAGGKRRHWADTVVTGLFKLWEQRQQRQADRSNPEVEIEGAARAEARRQAARLRQTYVKALPYHATLLPDQMLSAQNGNAPVALRQGVSGDKGFTWVTACCHDRADFESCLNSSPRAPHRSGTHQGMQLTARNSREQLNPG
jgi:hypothetical protein